MPTPHRLTHLHALGGASAKAAENEIRAAVVRAGGNVAEAARALGLHEKSLHRLITRWGLRAALAKDAGNEKA